MRCSLSKLHKCRRYALKIFRICFNINHGNRVKTWTPRKLKIERHILYIIRSISSNESISPFKVEEY